MNEADVPMSEQSEIETFWVALIAQGAVEVVRYSDHIAVKEEKDRRIAELGSAARRIG